MKNIKAIIFDAYGTLFDVNSAAEKCKDKIGDKWEGFANYWRTTQLEYTWLRSLMKRHKDFWQVTEDSLDKSMKAYEIDSSMRNELLDLYKILLTFKEVPEVLLSGDHTNWYSMKDFYGNNIDYFKDGYLAKKSNLIESANNDKFIIEELNQISEYNNEPKFFYLHMMSTHESSALEEKYKIEGNASWLYSSKLLDRFRMTINIKLILFSFKIFPP